MTRVRTLLPWPLVLLLVFTLGLAPYAPQPHFFEKLGMLGGGTLTKPIDIFDLLMHGTPWMLLLVRGVAQVVPESAPEE